MSTTTTPSRFANSFNDTAAGTDAYVTALLDLLGDRDPLDVVRATPAALERAVAGLDREKLHRPERAGKWSIGQVMAHLADTDLVWGYRMRRVLAEERPNLTGYDQDLWADRLGWAEAEVPESLAILKAIRAGNLRLLDRATEADLARIGVHNERGDESVARMLQLYAAHDLVHLNQIERIKKAVG
jgi:uncharacterized damage-inducible protein DinB